MIAEVKVGVEVDGRSWEGGNFVFTNTERQISEMLTIEFCQAEKLILT